MAEPAYNLETPRQEAEPAKPELRAVEREMSPDQADSLIDRMVEEYEETADETTKEMATEARAIDELSDKEGIALTAEETNDNARITTETDAAAGKLRTEIAAAFGSDVAGLESQLRSLDQELEAAVKGGDGTKVKELEARREQVDAERKQMMAKDVAPKEAAKGPEASVVLDFGQLLDHLSPEAQKAAAKNYEEADETAYGGLASKEMTPDGVVRLGYKDGTITEVSPGGETRSNLPGATGVERMPEEGGAAALTAEKAAVEQEKAPEKPPALERKARMLQLEEQMRGLEQKRKDAETPEAKLAAEQDLEKATKEWDALRKDWTEADEKNALEAFQKEMKQKRILDLENEMRELEKQYAKAESPDQKAAIARDLEARTKEWDSLRRADTGKSEPAAVEQAAALVAAAETIAAAAGTMADSTEKTQEVEKAKEAEQAALQKGPSSIAAASHAGEGGGSHGGGGGGGGGKDDGQFFKKVAEEWTYWEKLLGGWAKKG